MSIYTHKAKTWKATNTQEKIDALFTDVVRKRFWAKVEIGAPGECWSWTGCLLMHGYGSFGVKQMNFRAPRVAYMISKGPIPADLHILHSCNNRKCVNPDHLSVGTVQQNLKEREMFGNPAKGVTCGRTRTLDPEKVYAIRESAGRPCDVARRFGIHASYVQRIRERRAWRSLPERT